MRYIAALYCWAIYFLLLILIVSASDTVESSEVSSNGNNSSIPKWITNKPRKTVYSSISSITNTSYAQIFYDLALERYENITKNKNANESFYLEKLQIIRVPKASSTSLSIVARRMVGCFPAGPCCKFPGEPPGTCPNAELANCIKEKRVIGCIGHSVDMRTFRNRSIPTISVMREPSSRSLSAFFYPGMHHNSDCTKNPERSRLDCFRAYLMDRRFRNVMIKMLNGEFAYAKATTCRSSNNCKASFEKAKDNLSRLTFIGITEMWELSLLLLHYRFRKLPPVLAEFNVSDESSANAGNQTVYLNQTLLQTNTVSFAPLQQNILLQPNTSTNPFNVRTNNNPEYKAFKKMALEEYTRQLYKQNELDVMIYKFVVENLCNKLHKYKLWDNPIIQLYWKERAPVETKKCA